MEQTTFFEHYRVCRDENGTPIILGRIGPALNYKAVDTRSHQSVALHLIPIATVDPAKRAEFEERARVIEQLDHVNIAKVLATCSDERYVGLVSELVEGETVDAWMMANGPLPAEAVLRIGLQVVRALAAAAFLGLTHRAIQPSNIMIVAGQTADGGWPFVKLMNFGLAGLEIYSDGSAAAELSSPVTPQFSSPEQLLQHPLDFRSEMYSLGATMSFLLTGAVPLAVTGMKARLRARRLPGLRHAPKALRNLLTHMLRENPDNRPQDPVAFEREIQDCLLKVQRRQELGRKLGISLAVVPRVASVRSESPPSPMAQVWKGVIAFAALLLVGGVAAAFFLPEDVVPFRHRTAAAKEIGVPVGVPTPGEESQSSAQPAVAAPIVSNPNSPPKSEESRSTDPGSSPASEVAAAKETIEPPPPAQGPEKTSVSADNADPVLSSSTQTNVAVQSSIERVEPTLDSAETDNAKAADTSDSAPSVSSSSTTSKKNSVASTSHRRSTSSQSRVGQGPPNEYRSGPPRLRYGEVRAQHLGTTSDGRVILRLPSGRIVAVRPRQPDEEIAQRPHRRIIRGEMIGPAPYQPFDPSYPHD